MIAPTAVFTVVAPCWEASFFSSLEICPLQEVNANADRNKKGNVLIFIACGNLGVCSFSSLKLLLLFFLSL